jgi:hypothetical protein
MAANYPDYEGFAFSFQRAELTAADKIWTAISSVQFAQPTEEGVVKGTKPYPLARTVGSMGLGDGTLTFSDDRERWDFIKGLGDGFREKTWTLSWVIRDATTDTEVSLECQGCRVLDNAVSHDEGADALGGDIHGSKEAGK